MSQHQTKSGHYYIKGMDRPYTIKGYRRGNHQKQVDSGSLSLYKSRQMPKAPILLDLNQKGVRFKSHTRPCDECGCRSNHDLFYYKRSNRGRVFICQTCLNGVQSRSWQFIDALDMSWQGGCFNPR